MAETSDPRIPPRDRVVLRYVLDRLVDEDPRRVFAKFTDGSQWTRHDLREIARTYAAGFQALGVEQGDHVASFLPSSIEALSVWHGLNYMGAVYVPLNPAYKGALLEHTVATSDATLIVAHPDLSQRLGNIDLARLTDLVHLGSAEGGGPVIDGLNCMPSSVLTSQGSDPAPLDRPIEPWDVQGIWYTSGTTGPSKGVLSSYLHAYSMFGPETWPFVTENDRYMINLPVYHMGGTGLWNAMLLRGGSVSFVERFQTDQFWDQVRATESTSVFLLGAMAAFLEAQQPDPRDTDHPMRLMFMVPVVDDVPAFAERFGVEVRSIYNMSELCMPIITGPTPTLPGVCGTVREGVQVRLVDENDCEVPVGEVGEFVVRSEVPWSMNHGYYKMPEATAAAWRNGWFHTGDAGRMDEDGNYYFIDRLKDAIRRRGEFVSSLELEIELQSHPSVETAAVVGVKSAHAEEEILAVLRAAPGRKIDYVDLIEYLKPRVAYFMIPKYWRTVSEFPMTPTEKIRKVVLRDEGLTEDSWDRDEHGITIKSEHITTAGTT
tara:strand:+ start:347 stop:1984 length:1638 start_codon:yes stop_codon:yes gene_type:complete